MIDWLPLIDRSGFQVSSDLVSMTNGRLYHTHYSDGFLSRLWGNEPKQFSLEIDTRVRWEACKVSFVIVWGWSRSSVTRWENLWRAWRTFLSNSGEQINETNFPLLSIFSWTFQHIQLELNYSTYSATLLSTFSKFSKISSIFSWTIDHIQLHCALSAFSCDIQWIQLYLSKRSVFASSIFSDA